MGKSLTDQAMEVMGKNWSNSSLTREKNLGNVERLLDRIEAQSGLESLENLKPGHITAAFEQMQAEGLSASTLSGYATAARMVAEGIGKANIVPRDNESLGVSRAGERYNPIVSDPADRDQVQAALAERYGEHLALAHEMRESFGLRAKESLLSVNVVERDGKQFLQVEGAKGGRDRLVEIHTDRQRAAVAGVQAHLAQTGQRSLCPADKSLKQTYDQQRNALRAVGATKANASNAHASRHAYVQERSGQVSDRELAQEVGHNREEVLNHYRD